MRDYPSIPAEARTGLLLFGAAFCGQNDGRYLHEAGLVCTVVDTDASRLVEMEKHYPASWTFVQADAFEFVWDHVEKGTTWDVVSVDPFYNEAARTMDYRYEWAALARMMVVVGAWFTDIRDHGLLRSDWTMVPRNERWAWITKRVDKPLGRAD